MLAIEWFVISYTSFQGHWRSPETSKHCDFLSSRHSDAQP